MVVVVHQQPHYTTRAVHKSKPPEPGPDGGPSHLNNNWNCYKINHFDVS